jgi:hypothetical protein
MLLHPSLTQRPPTYWGEGVLIPSSLTVPYDAFATFPFLRLPPELRNKTYDLVFPECRIQLIGNHPQKELAKWKSKSPGERGRKPRYRLSCRLLANKDSKMTPVPLDMLEVCRKINQEATAYLYAKITFQFDSIKTINKFLNLAPKAGIKNITSIELIQNCYGEPRWTRDCAWKDKADDKWSLVCSRIALELTSLRQVELDLELATWPTQLKTTAPWARPLMVLRGSGLHRVRITLRHYMFPENRLMMAARRLEDLMMTPKGREERDLEEALEAVREFERKEAEKAMMPPVRATKSLVIKLAGPSTDTQINKNAKGAQGTAPKPKSNTSKAYYRTKGLEQYTRIDLRTVGVAFC